MSSAKIDGFLDGVSGVGFVVKLSPRANPKSTGPR
jgi:hypothetical protein